MPTNCPLCGQILPTAIDEEKLQAKLEKLTSAAKSAERKKLEEDFAARLTAEREVARQQAERSLKKEISESKEKLEQLKRADKAQIDKLRMDYANQLVKEREKAVVEAERLMKRQLEESKKQVEVAEKKKAAEVAKARKEATDSAQREVKLAIQKATLENQRKMSELQLSREKEQVRHSSELGKLQGKLEDLSRKLEKQSGEQFGEEGEIDLYSQLLREFPSDKIERIGRGVKGADVLHRVIDGGKEVGCIVYESKNVLTWQNAFVTQAKKYHTQYDTPYVMIVSRAFPKRARGMCVVENIPVIEPRLAAVLASVMREGIVEIAKLRLTKVGADEKAQELFGYVVGNEFQTRFRDMAEAVDGLKAHQQTERNWHENQWTKESDLHARIEKRHREIDSKMRLIMKGAAVPKPMAVAFGRR